MPRILFVLGGPQDIGGSERQLTMLLPELCRRGYAIEIMCLGGEGVLAPIVARQGVIVTAMPSPFRGRSGRFGRKLRAIVAGLLFARRTFQTRPDILHFFSPSAYVIGGVVSLLLPQVIRIMSRRGTNSYLTGHPIAAAIERFLHSRMAALLGNSRDVATELSNEGSPEERVGLIYNGVHARDSDGLLGKKEVRAQRELPEDSLVFIMIANLWCYKGHADLFHALAGIDPVMDWRLLLVGRDEGMLSELKQLARRLQISARVEFEGSVPNISPLLLAADVGVLPSHQEGFSNALLEYLSAGLPVVATDVGGNAEAVAEAGVIVPPKDPVSLRHALESMSDEGQRRRLAVAARARAQQFTPERAVDSYDRLYRALLRGKGIPPDLQLRPVPESVHRPPKNQSSGGN